MYRRALAEDKERWLILLLRTEITLGKLSNIDVSRKERELSRLECRRRRRQDGEE